MTLIKQKTTDPNKPVDILCRLNENDTMEINQFTEKCSSQKYWNFEFNIPTLSKNYIFCFTVHVIRFTVHNIYNH